MGKSHFDSPDPLSYAYEVDFADAPAIEAGPASFDENEDEMYPGILLEIPTEDDPRYYDM